MEKVEINKADMVDFSNRMSTAAGISVNSTGLTVSPSSSQLTITSPDSTTTYSGIVIVEGY